MRSRALARMQHELELGRQEVAKREWQLLGDKQPVEASRKRLALRVPQLRQAEIALTAAESALQRAQPTAAGLREAWRPPS